MSSFIYLFKINKVNPFPALTALFPLIFLSNLPNQESKYPPDLFIIEFGFY